MHQHSPSIIIPAHNEQSVIYKTLKALSPESNINNFKVVVVCNGCTDGTYNIVKNNFPSVLCLSTPKPSKALAIRHAESHIDGFPRIYLDADIQLNSMDARKIIDASEKFPQKLILPKSRVDNSNSNFFVSLYYDYWYKTSFVTQLGYGCGTYVLSQESRNQFNEWPDLISDDGFVRQLFEPEQIYIVENTCVKVAAPKTLPELIKVKTRSKYGTIELKEFHPSSTRKKRPFALILANPLSMLNYLSINLIAKYKAKKNYKENTFSWLRDDSSRRS